MKPRTVLFITSFVPVIVFKVLARVGEAGLAQAKLATAVGLALAVAQIALSILFTKHTNYLERAFLGFLAVGTACVYLAPLKISSFFVLNRRHYYISFCS